MPDARREERPSTRAGGPAYDRLDRRLDLDALDAPLDLDVLGTGPDGPLLSERLRDVLERAGVAPFVRRHRVPLAAGSLVVALGVAVLTSWWLTRPEPLPAAPRVLVTASGSDRTQVGLLPADGGLVGITLDVAVVSSERPGVGVALVALTGPALEPPRGDVADLGAATAGTGGTVSAVLDCASSASTAAGLAAADAEFGVEVRRTAPEGEVRVDSVPLVGAQRLAQVVRHTCLQAAAERELATTSFAATPLEGVVAANLAVTVRNNGTRTWPGMRVSTEGQPWIVNDGSPTDLAPDATTTLRARLWPDDCADPSAALADGLQVRASFAAADAVPYSADNADNTFRLRLDDAARRTAADAFAALCSIPAPTATVTSADLGTGGSDGSAGTLTLTLAVRSPGAALLEVDGGGPTASGLLIPLETPVHVVRGSGVLRATWALPPCSGLLAAGIPRFGVSLVPVSGGPRRPYALTLGGEELRIALVRACGDAARPLVR